MVGASTIAADSLGSTAPTSHYHTPHRNGYRLSHCRSLHFLLQGTANTHYNDNECRTRPDSCGDYIIADWYQVLGGIADTTAQMITAYRTRSATLPIAANTRAFIASDGVEMDDMNEKPARLTPTLSPLSSGPPPFDFERLTRFMSYGFIMAPLQFKWFALLTKWFPIITGQGTTQALKRVAMDQLLFAPFGLCCFFTFMTVAEGGGKRHLVKKFQDVYVPTLRANYVLWPAVQILNFRVIPLQFQIPFVSTIGIAWTAYLSLTNSSEDEALS